MANIEYNKNYNNTFAPNLLKLTDENSERQDNKVYNNKKGVLLYEDTSKQIFLKEELQVKNYVQCFKYNSSILEVAKSSGYDGEGYDNPRWLISSAYNYNVDIPFYMYIEDIWVPKINGVSDNNAYIRMNKGYFAFIGSKDLIESGDSEVSQKEGYIASISISLNRQEDSQIISKFRLTEVEGYNLSYLTGSEQEALLKKYGITSYLSSSKRVKSIYKLSLDGVSSWASPPYKDEGFGYDIDFFVNKEFNTFFNLSIGLSRYSNEDKYISESNTYKIPTKVVIQNRLIWVLTGLGWNDTAQTLPNFLSVHQVDLAYYPMQIWCPDQNYLTWTITTIGMRWELENNDIWGNGFRYLKWKCNTKNLPIGYVFYFTLNLFYNKGDVSYSASHVCQIVIE